MAQAQLKTQANDASVKDFLDSVPNETERADAIVVDKLMQKITGEKPKMWGDAIVGYGHDILKYSDGREIDWMRIAFSPRKGKLTLYVFRGGIEKYTDLLEKLGKHSTTKVCLYIKRLSDVDMTVLEKIIERSLTLKEQ